MLQMGHYTNKHMRSGLTGLGVFIVVEFSSKYSLQPFPTAYMSQNHGIIPRDHMTCRHLAELSPSSLHVPAFGILVNEAITPRDINSDSQPL
jgi:hypothetical protein